MNFIDHRGYSIPITKENETLIKKLKSELTVKPNVIPGYGPQTEYPVYKKNSTRFFVPKFYGIAKCGPNYETKERIGKSISISFNGSLKEDQINFTNTLVNNIEQNDSCIACATTGSGKTVMAINVISRIQKKTLIIVHKEFLMNQWIERVQQFSNATIGYIKGPKRDTVQSKLKKGKSKKIIDETENKTFEDCDIVIGMLQTIISKNCEKDIFDNFGLVIFDECHHICAKSFSQALFIVPTKKMLGLSATPTRTDGLTHVLNWFLGPVIYKDQLDNNIETPMVKIIKAEYENEIELTYNFMGKLNIADFINKLVTDKTRNEQIIDEIIEYSRAGRNILLLTERRNHCVKLRDNLLENKKFTGTVGLYLGQMKECDLKKSNDCSVIMATYQSANEGYDNPKLDTLILATGKTEIEQTCGRILRRKNKFRPLIIDIADTQYRANQVNSRKRYYKNKNFIIMNKKGKEFEECEEEEESFTVEFRSDAEDS